MAIMVFRRKAQRTYLHPNFVLTLLFYYFDDI